MCSRPWNGLFSSTIRKIAPAMASAESEITVTTVRLGRTQTWFQAQALQITNRIADLRWLVISQQTAHAPLLPVLCLIFLASIAIFGSFTLYVRPNLTVVTVISLSALAIAGAIFLIVELNNPFQGLLHISSQAAHEVAQTLGH